MGVRLLLCAAALVLALGGSARAATVALPFVAHVPAYKGSSGYDLYEFTLVAADGEANRLTIESPRPGAAELRVRDAGAALTPGEGCVAEDEWVVCRADRGTAQPQLQRTEVRLGDGHDELELKGLYASVSAGPGDDRVTSPDSAVSLHGGTGADYVRAPRGSVSYAGHTEGVRVTPDGVADDGAPGEGDDVGATFSLVIGGAGPDELHGAATPPDHSVRLEGGGGGDRLFGGSVQATLVGGEGDDSLLGGDGRDHLEGGPGADLMRGGGNFDVLQYGPYSPLDVSLDDRRGDGTAGENDDAGADIESIMGSYGDDRIVGSDGDNVIQGIAGTDVLDGAGGADAIHLSGYGGRATGGPGTDTIFAGGAGGPVIDTDDGERDTVRCGPRRSTFEFDSFDVFLGCTPALSAPSGRTYTVDAAGRVRPLASCRSMWRYPCAGRVYLYRRLEVGRPGAEPIGRARFSIAGNGKSARIEIRLVKAVRRELERGGRLRASARWRTVSTYPPSSESGGFELKLVRGR